MPSNLSTWLRAPRFRTADAEDSEHRQASWLELFFDLVFVVNVAGLVGILRDDLTLAGFGMFTFMFVLTWWVWMDVSYYGDQFDTDDAVYRAVLLLIMFGMLVTSRVSPDQLRDSAVHAPELTYAGMYVLLFGLYARAYRPNPELRPLIRYYLVAMAVGAIGYAVSAYLVPPYRFWAWGATLLYLMANSPIVYTRLPDLPSQLSHMPERFGLFAIITLGESVVAVAQGVAHAEQTWAFAGYAFAAFALATSLWWVFFNREDPSVISSALEGGRAGLLRSHVYGYSHFLVYLGIVVMAVGAEEALLSVGGEEASGEAHHWGAPARWCLAGGAALALAGTAVVSRASTTGLPGPAVALRLGVASVLVTLALGWTGAWAPTTLLLMVSTLCAGVVAGEFWLLPHPRELDDEAGA